MFVFTVPFVLFGPWSGYFADRFSKSKLMRIIKFVEIAIMLVGAAAFYWQNAAGSIALFFSTNSYLATSFLLIMTGVSAGLYIVPLFSYLQFVPNEHEKGRVLATVGVLNGLMMVLGSMIYLLFAVLLGFSADTIYLVMGIATIGAVICTCSPIFFAQLVSLCGFQSLTNWWCEGMCSPAVV